MRPLICLSAHIDSMFVVRLLFLMRCLSVFTAHTVSCVSVVIIIVSHTHLVQLDHNVWKPAEIEFQVNVQCLREGCDLIVSSPFPGSSSSHPSGHESSLEECVRVFEKTSDVQTHTFLSFLVSGGTRMRSFTLPPRRLSVQQPLCVCKLHYCCHHLRHTHASHCKSAPVASITESVGSISTSIKQKNRKPLSESTLPQALARLRSRRLHHDPIQQKTPRTPTHLVSTNRSPSLLLQTRFNVKSLR